MADPKGFLTTPRELPKRRPVDLRLMDWHEVYEDFEHSTLEKQAGRCMNCGIPFCHQGCPLGNLIPEWNDLVWRKDWREGIERLHATNNFPEFTGTLCPAPCEAACVLAINDDAVTIKQVELELIDRAWDEGWVPPQPASVKTGKKVETYQNRWVLMDAQEASPLLATTMSPPMQHTRWSSEELTDPRARPVLARIAGHGRANLSGPMIIKEFLAQHIAPLQERSRPL